jgi:hypothetical protein
MNIIETALISWWLGWTISWIIVYFLVKRSIKNGWIGLFKPKRDKLT